MNASRSADLCAHTTRACGSGVAAAETDDRTENERTASASESWD